ncbi:HAD family hydrolase [Tessaracoccus lubricantis]|uniref:HAD family hydrolase n=1 Tax=Tessaracoccus lubricantis TaxID=545543 RepID=A0ABP9FS64_9ACTN
MARLLATDVDGTLITTSHQISERTRAAFRAAKDAGIEVMAISGRQPYSIAAIVDGTALDGDAIGSNGAVAMNLDSRRVLFEETMELASQREIADRMLELFPGIKVVSVRSAGNSYMAEEGYTGLQGPGALETLWPVRHWFGPRHEVLAEPSLKLVLRDDDVAPDDLLAAARELAVPGCHATTSGAPFLEVGRDGVTKASALARYCEARGIDRSDVVVFGDNINDLEMLRWAGLGVAMANGEPEARAAADHVTLSNDDDGVAVVIEEILSRD